MASAIVPEELRDGNYDSWSGCMKNYLLAHDLWDIIEGPNSSTEPPPHDEAEYKVWRKKNATALHAIQISCRPYIFRRIESTDSAKTVWDNLANSLRKRLPVSQGKNAGDIPTSDTDTDSDSDFSDTDSVSADKKREPFASSQSTGAANFRTDSASSDKKQEPLTSSQRNGADPVSSNIKQEPLASLQHNGPGVVKDENFQFAGLANSVYRGDWHSTRSFLVRHPGVVNAKITSFGHTALHIATLAGNVEIGRKLVELMSKEALAIQDGSGYTALHHAASRGIAKMARYMVEKDETLVAITSKCQWIPIVAACANNHRDTTVYLFSVTPFELLSQYQNGIHGSLLLQHAITSKMLGNICTV
ncbi:unnamed protein product [Dovyalis caffra]|uniref:DUF4219 domain-containing protein n=1 Tax=Dovyalis caffra TaxID=77055 RepID=A0AAV1RUX9_9ROSI|nr:unnamed protein product [Dovyalis caffra]